MAYTTADIRNVCLVGPGQAGKTQLAEALLATGGAISHAGSVEKGDTVSDYNPKEKELGHSLYPSVCHLDHAGIHVNLIDTPGYRDFFGRAVAVLPAVETAAIVIDAENKQLNVDVSEDEMVRRRSNWQRPPSPVKTGALAKYRATVSSASEGATTIPPAWDE